MLDAAQKPTPPAWKVTLDRIGFYVVVGLSAAYVLFLLAVWWYVYFCPVDLF